MANHYLSSQHANKLRASERRIEAMRPRKEGLTYTEIGERLGCSRARAHAIVTEEFARLRTQQNELAEDLLRLAKDRLERLHATFWLPAIQGDQKAAEMVLKVIDRQARLLGLDAPRKTKAELEVTELSPEEVRARARMMGVDLSDLEAGEHGTERSAGTGLPVASAGEFSASQESATGEPNVQ